MDPVGHLRLLVDHGLLSAGMCCHDMCSRVSHVLVSVFAGISYSTFRAAWLSFSISRGSHQYPTLCSILVHSSQARLLSAECRNTIVWNDTPVSLIRFLNVNDGKTCCTLHAILWDHIWTCTAWDDWVSTGTSSCEYRGMGSGHVWSAVGHISCIQLLSAL